MSDPDKAAAWLCEVRDTFRQLAQEANQVVVDFVRTHSAAADEPQWIVNDIGELGVRIGNRFFFLYKGDNIEYGSSLTNVRDGIALHDDGTPMHYRMVGKREFGEVCHPVAFYREGFRRPERYTEELVYTPGLSWGQPEDGAWRPLPAATPLGPDDKPDGCVFDIGDPHAICDCREAEKLQAAGKGRDDCKYWKPVTFTKYETVADILASRDRLRASHSALVKALEDAIFEYDRNTCTHESTHRGGAIWTICDDCGAKWADDRGGFQSYQDPERIVNARAALASAKEVL